MQATNGRGGVTLSSNVSKLEVPPAAIRSPPSVKNRRKLLGHFGKVMALQWGGDSRTVVSAAQDGNLLIWNAVSANKVKAIPLKSSYVMSVGMEQSQGKLVACGGLDNMCTVYNVSNPKDSPHAELNDHTGFLSCCRFLSEERIVTSSGDSTCILWDIPNALPVSKFQEHKSDAMFLSVKPGDSNIFLSGSVDKTVKVWDIRTPESSVQTFSGHTADVNAVEFFPTGNTFASCGQDNTVRVFDLRAYNELACLGTPKPPPPANQPEWEEEAASFEGLTSLAISRSGRMVFCGHTDGSVRAFDLLSEKTTVPVYKLKDAHERQVSCVGVAPNGDALCTGSWDANLKIWA